MMGQTQARLTAKRLRGLPIHTIHHSTLARAVETAHILAEALPHVPLHPTPLLRECIPCVPTRLEKHFAHIPPDFIAQGRAQAEQAWAAFVQPLAEGEETRYELLMSHGNLINYFASQAVQAPIESWVCFDIQQGGLTEIGVAADGWHKLVRHNDTGHLPSELRVFL